MEEAGVIAGGSVAVKGLVGHLARGDGVPIPLGKHPKAAGERLLVGENVGSLQPCGDKAVVVEAMALGLNAGSRFGSFILTSKVVTISPPISS
jgi:hypothetical protein